MAHFVRKSALRTHRIGEYGSFAVLDFQTNCTHGQAPLAYERNGVKV